MRLLLLTSFFALALNAEIIDRIAVSVGNRAIAESEVIREIRIAAFLDGKAPDLSPAAKRAAAERLVEQTLVRRELETSRYRMASPSEVELLVADFKSKRFRDAAAWRGALAAAGVSEDDVKKALLWQRSMLLFLSERFGSGVQLSEQEIEDYFVKTVKPAAEAARPGEPVTLDEFRDRIEEALTGARADVEMDNWLRETRARTEIVFHEEAFQ